MATIKEGGWAFPGGSKKWHFFDPHDLRSLCNKWMFAGERDADTGKPSPDDCAECAKRLAKRRAPPGGAK